MRLVGRRVGGVPSLVSARCAFPASDSSAMVWLRARHRGQYVIASQEALGATVSPHRGQRRTDSSPRAPDARPSIMPASRIAAARYGARGGVPMGSGPHPWGWRRSLVGVSVVLCPGLNRRTNGPGPSSNFDLARNAAPWAVLGNISNDDFFPCGPAARAVAPTPLTAPLSAQADKQLSRARSVSEQPSSTRTMGPGSGNGVGLHRINPKAKTSDEIVSECHRAGPERSRKCRLRVILGMALELAGDGGSSPLLLRQSAVSL
jgi:hypothetical protein